MNGSALSLNLGAKQAVPRQLVWHRYVENHWRPQAAAMVPRRLPHCSHISCAPLRELRVLTWNIWFDHKYQQERTMSLLKTIEQREPDIVCLQEVTPRVLKAICEHPSIRKHYFVSDCQGYTVDPYGTTIFSRHPLQGLIQHTLPSRQGRTLLLAELLQENGHRFLFGNVHLESMKTSASQRQEQLQLIFPILKSFAPASVSLMGDFNFCSSWDHENKHLDASFEDIWPLIHGKAAGYSEDSHINKMLAIKLHGQSKQVRFDRVLLASQQWQATSIELLGTEPVQDDCFVSDHFGLQATLKLKSV